MKKMVLFALMGVFASMLTHTLFAQACLVKVTPNVQVTPVANHTNWWIASVVYKNVSNGGKSFHIFGTVTNPATNNRYDHCETVTCQKNEDVAYISSWIYSTTEPKLQWETYTGTGCHGTVCNNQGLPVRFVSCTAEPSKDAALLKWTVASDEESPFIIERSTDNGYSFKEIGRVPQIAGTTQYSYTDHSVFGQTEAIYRIKTGTGANTYSKLMYIRFSGTASFRLIGSTIYLFTPAGTQARLLNTTGQTLVATTAKDVPLGSYPYGVYILKVVSSGGIELFSEKIMYTIQ